MRLAWQLPLERLSATSMGTFIQCPEQFRQKYLRKEKEPMHGARFMGIVDHAVIERLVRARQAAGSEAFDTTVLPEVTNIYANEWDNALDEYGDEVTWKNTTPEKEFEIGVKMIKAYAKLVIPEIKPVAMEERVEFTVPGVPGKVIGYVDILESDKIRERKTANQKVAKPKPKWRFQGLIYQAALGLGVQWDVVTRQVTPQVYTAKEWPDLWLAPRAPKEILAMIRDTAWYMNDCYQRYGADDPWPTTGIFGDWLCDYCPIGPKFGGSCRLWKTDF